MAVWRALLAAFSLSLTLALSLNIHLAAATTASCSCSNTRSNFNLGTGHIAHLTPIGSAAACCAHCQASPACQVWVWSRGEAACWLKDNAAGGGPEADRVAGVCSGPFPPGPPPPPSPPPPPPSPPSNETVRVALGGVVARAGLPEFASFTLDWWAPDQGCSPSGWGPHANVLELDFGSPKLQALVGAMAPAFLRIGGSLDKKVVYAVPGSGRVYNTSSCPLPLCLNATRWDALHAFARRTGVRIVFGLSFPQDSPGHWNSSQAEALLRYSRAQGYDASTTLFGFELGEELTSFQLNTSAFTAYTASYHRAAALLQEVWPEAGARPRLLGPCPGMAWPELATWMPAFLEGTRGALDTMVYHSYNQIHPTPPRVLYLNTTCPAGDPARQHGATPGGTGWQAVAMRGYASTAGAGVPLWLGEGGDHNGGGGGPFAATFVDSLYYVDALGVLSELNHSVFARQTLAGGNYELLRCSTGQLDGHGCDFEPNPDFWAALLWQRTMGPTTLNVTFQAAGARGAGRVAAAPPGDLRVHAHCAAAGLGVGPGAVALSWTNMNDANRTFLLGGPLASLGRRFEWTLSASNASLGLDDRRVVLNGGAAALAMGGAHGTELPYLGPRTVPAAGSGSVSAAPRSLGFVVFPDAGLAACRA